ncbi:EamA family transporter [Spirosoma koreense]
MSERIKWLLFIVGIELVSLLADYLIKKASLQVGWTGWKPLLLGGLIYGGSAVGWFYAMRSFKLFTVGVFHSVIVIALSLLLSQFVFGEKITPRELAGVALGILAIILLIRP